MQLCTCRLNVSSCGSLWSRKQWPSSTAVMKPLCPGGLLKAFPLSQGPLVNPSLSRPAPFNLLRMSWILNLSGPNYSAPGNRDSWWAPVVVVGTWKLTRKNIAAWDSDRGMLTPFWMLKIWMGSGKHAHAPQVLWCLEYSAMYNFIRIEIRKLLSLVMKINRDILSGKTFLFLHSQSYLGWELKSFL